jgi:predicted phage tail protein
VGAGGYTQITILVPSTEVELPAAEKFGAYPIEAQRTILQAFEREQKDRHLWQANEQAHNHELNLLDRKHDFAWRMAGVLAGALLTLSTIALGAWLVAHGAGGTGVAMMIGAAAALIGTALYGHKAQPERMPSQQRKALSNEDEQR